MALKHTRNPRILMSVAHFPVTAETCRYPIVLYKQYESIISIIQNLNFLLALFPKTSHHWGHDGDVEAMNVMSMIRAAGRAGDVPKALELLHQLELGEKCRHRNSKSVHSPF